VLFAIFAVPFIFFVYTNAVNILEITRGKNKLHPIPSQILRLVVVNVIPVKFGTEVNRFVTVTNDQEFCIGTKLLRVDTSFNLLTFCTIEVN